MMLTCKSWSEVTTILSGSFVVLNTLGILVVLVSRKKKPEREKQVLLRDDGSETLGLRIFLKCDENSFVSTSYYLYTKLMLSIPRLSETHP